MGGALLGRSGYVLALDPNFSRRLYSPSLFPFKVKH